MVSETERGLERKELIEFGEKKLDPLFLHIEPNWQCLGPRGVQLSEPLNIEQSLREYMEHTNDKMAQEILENLPKLLGGEVS